MSDEPLFVIFHLNRIISLRASTLQDSLAARVAACADADGDADPPAETREDVEASLSASVALSLKRHLKLTYDLADARTRAYNPAEPLKSAEAFRYDEDASEMDLSWCDPAAGATVAGCRAQAELFARLMRDDANDYGEYAASAAAGARRRRAPSRTTTRATRATTTTSRSRRRSPRRRPSRLRGEARARRGENARGEVGARPRRRGNDSRSEPPPRGALFPDCDGFFTEKKDDETNRRDRDATKVYGGCEY